MNPRRNTAKYVGILIILAYSIVGYEASESSKIKLFLELISGAAVVGMAILMYPVLESHNKTVTQSYFVSKSIEGIVMIAAGILIFTGLITSGTHEKIYDNHTYIFAIAFLILSYLLYQSKLVPRFIPIWGLVASILFGLGTFVDMVGLISVNPIFILPFVVLNELVLAIWFIVKGFNEEAVNPAVTVAGI